MLIIPKLIVNIIYLAIIGLFILSQVVAPQLLAVEVFAFVFLSIFPGMIMLDALALTTKSGSVQVVYSIGLSIGFLIIVGLLVNTLMPLFRIDNPLGYYPLLISISVSLVVLVSITWKTRTTRSISVTFPTIKEILYLLPLALFLLLSVLGATSLNNKGTNVYTMLLLFGIALYVIGLTLMSGKRKEGMIAISIFCIALSILLMFSLRSWHIIGWDINQEYEVFQLTKLASVWSTKTTLHEYNACLSITILPTILSRFITIPDEYIYKLLYQVYFAIVPVVMYLIFRQVSSKGISFLAVFYYISQPFFIQPMPALLRQEIAFIFFGLFLLTLQEDFTTTKQAILLVMLGSFMVFSHYSTTYVALIFCAITLGIITGLKHIPFRRSATLFTPLARFYENSKNFHGGLRFSIIALLGVLTIFWYSYLNHSANTLTSALIDSFSEIKESFSTDLKSGDVSETLSIFPTNDPVSFQKDITAYVNPPISKSTREAYYLPSTYSSYTPSAIPVQTVFPVIKTPVTPMLFTLLNLIKFALKLFTLCGAFYFVFVLYNYKESHKELLLMIITAALSILSLMLLPTLSILYNVTRLFMQALMLLALPTLTLGVAFFHRVLPKYTYGGITLLVVVYFLYLSGFLTNLLGGQAYVQLNNFGNDFDKFYTFDQEVAAARWFAKHRDPTMPIYTDEVSNLRLHSFGFITTAHTTIAPKAIQKTAYVYVRYQNMHEERADATYQNRNIIYFTYPMQFLATNKDLLYNNGGSEVFR